MTPREPEDGGANRTAVAALVFGSLVAGLLQTIVLQLQDDFPVLLDAPRELTSWIVTVTILTACAFSPVSSRLGDTLGRRRVIIALLLAMSVGSVVAALAPDIWVLIFGRALQGLAIGVIPLAMSIMKDIVAPAKLGGAIALTSGTLGIGSAFGLPLGALINELMGWRGIFWVCFLMGTVAVVWVWAAVPSVQVLSRGRFDVPGAIGLGAGVSLLLVALAQALSWGWASGRFLLVIGVGVMLLLFTAVHLLRSPEPIIDLRASSSPRIWLTNTGALLLNFSMMGANVVFPQLMVLPVDSPAGLGVDRVTSGIIMMAAGVTTAIATPLIATLNTRFGPKRLMVVGAAIVALSLGSGLFLPWSVALILGINIGLGFGFGLSFASMPQIIMESVDRRNTAAANGVNAQLRFFGTAMASAVIAGVLADQSVSHAGASVPTVSGFMIAVGICTAAALIATVLCILIPPLNRHPGEQRTRI